MGSEYPIVQSEDDTVEMLLAGRSIARYGDGEFNIVAGGHCVSQKFDKHLQHELREILWSTDPGLIVGIPRLCVESPKRENWLRTASRYPKFLSPSKTYYSSFITRPDSAPWIYSAAYYDKIESLWRGVEIALVHGSDRSLTAESPMMASAAKIHTIQATYRDSYAMIDELEAQVLATKAQRVILCVGPCATALAHRLSRHGVHALDLGHIGRYWYKEPTPC